MSTRRLKRYFPTSAYGNRLRHYLLLGISYDFPIIGIHWPSAVPKNVALVSPEQGTLDIRSLGTAVSTNGCYRNTVPMPFVGSFQRFCTRSRRAFLLRKWMRHGTSLTRFGVFTLHSAWTMKRFDLNAAQWKSWQSGSSEKAGNVTDRWILTASNKRSVRSLRTLTSNSVWLVTHRLIIWDEFADWYVWVDKEVLYSDNEGEKVITRSVLLYTMDQILRLPSQSCH